MTGKSSNYVVQASNYIWDTLKQVGNLTKPLPSFVNRHEIKQVIK